MRRSNLWLGAVSSAALLFTQACADEQVSSPQVNEASAIEPSSQVADGSALSADLSVAVMQYDQTGKARATRGYGKANGILKNSSSSGAGEVIIGNTTKKLRLQLAIADLNTVGRSESLTDSVGNTWQIRTEPSIKKRQMVTVLTKNNIVVSRVTNEYTADKKGQLKRSTLEAFDDGVLRSELAIEVLAISSSPAELVSHEEAGSNEALARYANYSIEPASAHNENYVDVLRTAASSVDDGTPCFLLVLKMLYEAAMVGTTCANWVTWPACGGYLFELISDMNDWTQNCAPE